MPANPVAIKLTAARLVVTTLIIIGSNEVSLGQHMNWPTSKPELYKMVDTMNAYIQQNPTSAQGYAGRAQIYMNVGEYQKGLVDAEKAITLNPSDTRLYSLRSCLYITLKKWREALLDLNALAQKDSNNFGVFNNRAIVFTELGQYKEAIADATKAISLNPNSTDPYVTLSDLCVRMGAYKQAIDYANAVIRKDSGNGEVYYHRGEAYEKLGQVAVGKKDKELALKRGYKPGMITFNQTETQPAKGALVQSYASQSSASQSSATQSSNSQSNTSNSAASAQTAASSDKLADDLLDIMKPQGKLPAVTPTFAKQAKAALVSIPLPVLAFLRTAGCRVKLVSSTVEIDYRLQNTRPKGYDEQATFKNNHALFNGRDVVIGQFHTDSSGEYVESSATLETGAIRHETGHAVDRYLGRKSSTEEFKHAYYLDAATVPPEVQPQIDYFLQKDRTGPAETFAELCCYRFGGRTDSAAKNRTEIVHQYFKQCDALIGKYLNSIGCK